MQQMYAELENRGQQGSGEQDKKKKKAEESVEAPPGLAPGEYYAYVYDSFSLDFAKPKVSKKK